MTKTTAQDTLFIEEYTFHEFLLRFQNAISEGFELDLDSNEYFPQKFGSQLTVTLVKREVGKEADTVQEVQPEVLISYVVPVPAQVVPEAVQVEPEAKVEVKPNIDFPTPKPSKRKQGKAEE